MVTCGVPGYTNRVEKNSNIITIAIVIIIIIIIIIIIRIIITNPPRPGNTGLMSSGG